MANHVPHDIAFMLTPRVALEIMHHESACLEAFKDSKGVWTWGIGVTDRSGHKVGRYLDKPSDLATVISVYLWLLKANYAGRVLDAFVNYPLQEHEFAAALSFHYNTGRIASASWVSTWKAVKDRKPGVSLDDARDQFLEWDKPKEIIPRREAEADLFFKDKWAGDGNLTVFPVKKPSYTPDMKHPRKIDVREIVAATLRAHT